MGVKDATIFLAQRYGADPKKAAIAGLLHDCAKCMSNEKLLNIINEKVGDIDQSELLNYKTYHAPVGQVTVMVQKEVADRMQAGPGSKDYGALSLAVQYYAQVYLAANVPPNCFIPRPNVGSAVIRLDRHKQPPVKVKDEGLLFALIRASFNQRRKTLQNGLNNSPEIPYTKEQIGEAIKSLGLPAAVRGEALTLEQFGKLADYFGVFEGKEG